MLLRAKGKKEMATLTEFCFGMIGRADIEGLKSNVAMNAWLRLER